jgi:L-iditol 2-dehydrogenase
MKRKTMKAYVKPEKNEKPRFEEIPVPTIGEEEVLVRVRSALICGTDLLVRDGRLDETVYPLVLGHEFSGEIVEKGDRVSDLKIGDRVAANAVRYCRKCFYCKTGRWNLCEDFQHLGIHCDGCFAPYVALPDFCVTRIPHDMAYDVASAIGPVALVYHAMRKVKIGPGSLIVISGPGPIGLTAIQLALISGARVLNTGMSADGSRLETAKNLGAMVLNVEKEDLRDKVMEISDGEGADVFVETSGAPIIQQGFEVLRRGGIVLLIGYSPKPQPINALDVVFRELRLEGSSGYNDESWKMGLKIISDHPLIAKRMISHVFDFEALDEGFQVMLDRKAIKVGIHYPAG